MSKGPVRRIRLRAVVAYPAVSLALVAAVALALTPFGPSQVMALAAEVTPTATETPSTTTTTDPSTTTTAAPVVTTTAAPVVTTTAVPTPSLSSGTVAGPVDHHVLARIEGPEFQANYLAVDEPALDASQFQTFRVRFRLHNAGTAAITTTPRLEYRPEGVGGYLVAPEKPLPGVPLHVSREWVPSLGLGGGTMQSELGEDMAVADFRLGDEPGFAVTGHHSMGANPDNSITLPAASYTEEEFTVTLSIDAKYLTGYELRITDGGTALTGTDVAVIRLGAAPAVLLSPGQRQGVAVVDPTHTASTSAAAYPLLSAQSIVADTSPVSAVSAVYRPNTVTYPLTASTLSAATVAPDEIHGPYSMTADKCATCHRAHTAQAPTLLVKAGSQSTLCFTCHGPAAGAATDVQTQYTDTALPANVPSAREYYSHDATNAAPAAAHTRSELDEFGGVSNRHSECADCHNSHKAGTTDSTQSADGTGWDASGRLAGVSGVSVVNGTVADSVPAPADYTFLDGVIKPVTREYQLCFKCHSGFTALTSNAGLKPSQYALDKAVEFNPANDSFHPVEAAGTNKTAKMDLNLAGGSPYKMWDFTSASTIRCLNCHASGTTPDATPTPLPAPGSALAPHTSSNRGILLRNYRDRVLKPSTIASTTDAAYSAGDFALCYVCHGEEPFANASSPANSNATNFKYHGKHLTGLPDRGAGGTSIDTAGAGEGNAICAECHFRIHSTTNKVGAQVIPGTRLVNFAPNVQPFVPAGATSGTISWTPGATGGGSCTLTCHGYAHNGYSYSG